MGEIFLTSDSHFGHANIIKYCNRPFEHITEMDEALISNYNEVVKPSDTVYHLGDFAFSRTPEKYFYRLNGNVHLILGNHDDESNLRNCQFASVQDVLFFHHNSNAFWLSHYAHLRWPRSHHGTYHMFGHSHGGLNGYGRSMDVGVDAQNYYPIHIDDVIKKLKKIAVTPHHGED